MTIHNEQLKATASAQPDSGKTSNSRARRAVIALGLALVLLLAAFLRTYELGATSIGNTYYAATVQSMLTSWHNFFFVAFEPGGSVTVDKPPLGFWIQAVSAYFLGVNGFALALPQALAGVLSVLLLYGLVKRHFGAPAGLLAALILAVTPVAVSTERNNTIDGLLVCVLLLAACVFVEAVHSGRLRWLWLGAILIGLGFNIKMLQAYMILPALYTLYFLGAPHRWWKRLIHLAAATALMLVVSLSWAVAVDLTPAEQRPYIGSSTNNSVMELIAGHNGIRRLFSGKQVAALGGDARPGQIQPQPRPGQPLRPGAFPGGQPPQAFGPQGGAPGVIGPRPPVMPAGPGALPPQGYGVPDGGESGAAQQPGTGAPPAGQPDKRNQEIGQAGWERLFIEPLATEASWVFPLALLGIPLALALLGWRWPLSGKHLGLVLWAGWLLPEVIYFSFATGLFHAYYLIMLGPPLAALVAITAWALWRLLQRHRWLGWVLAALFSGITLAFQLFTLSRYPQNGGWIAALSLPIWLTGIGLLLWRGRLWLGKAALALVCLSLLIAPLAWSGMTAFNTQPNVMLPNPGPGDAKGPQRQDLSILSVQQQKILDYLLAHSDPDSYLVATLNARQAAPYILATLRPILTFGGFTGSDNVVDVKNLAQMVAGGELRFVLVEPGFERQKPKIAAWLQRQCTVVKLPGLKGRPLPQAGPSAPGGEPVALLDCG